MSKSTSPILPLLPREYHFSFSFDHVPPNMLRGRHALIVLKDADKTYILGAKQIYPPGMTRFVGGGIEVGEDPRAGAAREVKEELGISVDPDTLHHIATIIAEITNSPKFTTYLYFANIGNAPIIPADDLSGIQRLNDKDMVELVRRYSALSSDLFYDSEDKASFRWSDYGKLYGPVHEIGYELTKEL